MNVNMCVCVFPRPNALFIKIVVILFIIISFYVTCYFLYDEILCSIFLSVSIVFKPKIIYRLKLAEKLFLEKLNIVK